MMDFEDYYKTFAKLVKAKIGVALWDKAARHGDPKEFCRELYNESGLWDTPREAALSYIDYVNEMEEEGEFGFDEGMDGDWKVEYEDLDGNVKVETDFDTEGQAWLRYNELETRTRGTFADLAWVKEPVQTHLADECGGSAASLGATPNGGSQMKDEEAKGVEDFLSNALDNAMIEDPNSGELYTLKLTADAGEFELVVLLPNGEHVTLKTGPLFAVTDYYRELVEMDAEDAVALIESSYTAVLSEEA